MVRPRISEEEKELGRRLGAALRDARRTAGQSAQTVAGTSGLSIDTVRSIETGRTAAPSFITVVRIADALGVSLDQLRDRSWGERGSDD
ncbi:MAG: helix-turn-helix domain-containing protein [Leucobacter sp.]